MKGKGTVHFIDEHKRPREVTGTIIVDYRSVFHPPYVKVQSDKLPAQPLKKGEGEFLMPFNQIVYIEWEGIEQ